MNPHDGPPRVPTTSAQPQPTSTWVVIASALGFSFAIIACVVGLIVLLIIALVGFAFYSCSKH